MACKVSKRQVIKHQTTYDVSTCIVKLLASSKIVLSALISIWIPLLNWDLLVLEVACENWGNEHALLLSRM